MLDLISHQAFFIFLQIDAPDAAPNLSKDLTVHVFWGIVVSEFELKSSLMQDVKKPTYPPASHRECANAIRFLSLDAVQKAQSGHPGMPMGMADIATVLFRSHFKANPQDPQWSDRDRFVLSNGHGSMLLYAVNYLLGYEKMTLEELQNFRQSGSHTAGHPELDRSLGIETTTGPLGQGLANAVGMALAERMMNAHFGDALVNHNTYAFVGDGCLMEGISHEAISLAGHLKLSKLIVFLDDNGITIDGKLSLSSSDEQLKRFEACGWDVTSVDGHDHEAIHEAILQAKQHPKPSLIACKTIIGFGSPHKAGTSAVHGSPLGEEEIQETRKALEWPYKPFEIPPHILATWRNVGTRSHKEYEDWGRRLQNSPLKSEFLRRMLGQLPQNWHEKVHAYKQQLLQERPSTATRQSSGTTLEILTQELPELTGGSADLTGSNNTKAKEQQSIAPGHYAGSYVYYGIREHGMAAAMNGLALHGGIIPYGGTFLCFSDYCRPAIRLSALMKQRVIYVMTHDSIGLGEDGPTHQPVEHLAALRTIPNLNVLRPADAVEVAECWEIALESSETPSVLVLTRQSVPTLRTEAGENLCRKGAYVLKESQKSRHVTLLATGSEVNIAILAREDLAKKGIEAAVVSMPCWELFLKQPQAYQEAVLGGNTPRVAVEAAIRMGWDQFIGADAPFIGMRGFGASAPAKDLYEHFKITPAAVVAAVEQHLA